MSPLRQALRTLEDLTGLIGLATWDQETFMPPKASDARGHQLAALATLHHERLTAPALGDLLAAATTDDEKAMARVVGRKRDRAMRVPARLVKALAEAQSRGLVAWHAARAAKSFAPFGPALAELLALRREQADAIGHGGDRYDALLGGYEPGMTVARLDPVLTRLADQLVPMVAALKDRQPPDLLAGRRFDATAQGRFARLLLEDMGFDFDRGRVDRSVHPFSGGTDATDVRLTTRIDEANLWPGIFATIHEGGHGLYAQGVAEEVRGTPLAWPPSMGLDESQSRLYENFIGRSRPFWVRYFPKLQALVGLEDLDVDQFLSSINRVAPSLVRGGADELTYNLHIALRYGLERALLSGALPIADLPAEWNQRTQALLGLTPPDDLKGVLQDIHWATGDFGYFPTYTLGNLYAASLFAAMKRAPDDLAGIRAWLGENVWAHGARDDAEVRVTRVCGHGLRDDDFLAHLSARYGG